MASNSFSITLRGKVPRPMHKFSFYLTPKESLEFKVSGFGSDGQHLQLVASLPGLVSIKQSARPKQLEQGVTITAINTGTVAIHARESTAKSGSYLNNCAPVNDRFGGCFPILTINIIDTVAMPGNLNPEQKAMLMVLLAEVKKPTGEGHNETNAIKSMQYMRQALYNRLKFSRPDLLDVPRGSQPLIGLIKSGRVIEGFTGYPILSKKVQNNIDAFFLACNTGNSQSFMAYRKLLKEAVKIARGENSGTITGELIYGWRTKGKGSPGSNFKYLFDLAGQTFYGLQQKFITSPMHPN